MAKRQTTKAKSTPKTPKKRGAPKPQFFDKEKARAAGIKSGQVRRLRRKDEAIQSIKAAFEKNGITQTDFWAKMVQVAYEKASVPHAKMVCEYLYGRPVAIEDEEGDTKKENTPITIEFVNANGLKIEDHTANARSITKTA